MPSLRRTLSAMQPQNWACSTDLDSTHTPDPKPNAATGSPQSEKRHAATLSPHSWICGSDTESTHTPERKRTLTDRPTSPSPLAKSHMQSLHPNNWICGADTDSIHVAERRVQGELSLSPTPAAPATMSRQENWAYSDDVSSNRTPARPALSDGCLRPPSPTTKSHVRSHHSRNWICGAHTNSTRPPEHRAQVESPPTRATSPRVGPSQLQNWACGADTVSIYAPVHVTAPTERLGSPPPATSALHPQHWAYDGDRNTIHAPQPRMEPASRPGSPAPAARSHMSLLHPHNWTCGADTISVDNPEPQIANSSSALRSSSTRQLVGALLPQNWSCGADTTAHTSRDAPRPGYASYFVASPEAMSLRSSDTAVNACALPNEDGVHAGSGSRGSDSTHALSGHSSRTSVHRRTISCAASSTSRGRATVSERFGHVSERSSGVAVSRRIVDPPPSLNSIDYDGLIPSSPPGPRALSPPPFHALNRTRSLPREPSDDGQSVASAKSANGSLRFPF